MLAGKKGKTIITKNKKTLRATKSLVPETQNKNEPFYFLTHTIHHTTNSTRLYQNQPSNH